MSEVEARRLLAAVRKASAETQQAHAAMMAASASRAQAVQDALDAGLPRAEIAEAAGVARTMIYRIASGETTQ